MCYRKQLIHSLAWRWLTILMVNGMHMNALVCKFWISVETGAKDCIQYCQRENSKVKMKAKQKITPVSFT